MDSVSGVFRKVSVSKRSILVTLCYIMRIRSWIQLLIRINHKMCMKHLCLLIAFYLSSGRWWRFGKRGDNRVEIGISGDINDLLFAFVRTLVRLWTLSEIEYALIINALLFWHGNWLYIVEGGWQRLPFKNQEVITIKK